MDKIRIGKDNVYQIEVNDNGDCIDIDLLDIELPVKFVNASKTLKRETKIYNEKVEKENNMKILLIEDNDSIILGLEYLFKEEKFEFEYVKFKKDAINILGNEMKI